jgi:hypothetical protein
MFIPGFHILHFGCPCFFFRAFFHNNSIRRPKTPCDGTSCHLMYYLSHLLSLSAHSSFALFSVHVLLLLFSVVNNNYYSRAPPIFIQSTNVWHHFLLVSYNKPDKHDYNTIVVSHTPCMSLFAHFFCHIKCFDAYIVRHFFI